MLIIKKTLYMGNISTSDGVDEITTPPNTDGNIFD